MKLPVSKNSREVFDEMGGKVFADFWNSHHVIGVHHVADFAAEKILKNNVEQNCK